MRRADARFERVNHQQQLHQVLVHRTARRLHHENIRAAHVLLDLDVSLAVLEARHQRLVAHQAQKLADIVRQLSDWPCR